MAVVPRAGAGGAGRGGPGPPCAGRAAPRGRALASRPGPAARLPLHLAPGSGEPAYALLERLSRRYGAGSPAAFAAA
ncbi:hypothetical protein CCS92_34050, partial [Methylobacterium radiotolerans]